MKPLSFEDICPEAAEFTLQATKKTYRLRPVSMEDRSWMFKRYGEGLIEILQDFRHKELSVLVIHQMHPDDKKDFILQEVEIIDEETGESTIETIGGAQLLRTLLQSMADLESMFIAFTRTMGASQVLVDKIDHAQREEKKRLENLSQSTGKRPLTSSHLNTDGPSSKSENVQKEKSISP